MYPPIRLLGRALVSPYFRLRITKETSFPRRGPAILVGNHTSLIDGALLHAITLRPLRVLVAAEWADWWAFRWYFRLMQGIRVGGKGPGAGAFDGARRALQRGDALVLFPEGGIQDDGSLGPFRSGAARLALETGAPVFPCGIVGAFEAFPWGRAFPLPRRITVRCGGPITFDREADSPPSKATVANATARIRQAVADQIALGHAGRRPRP